MKVIHLPIPTGGNSWGLSKAERELGIDSKVLVKFNNYFKYNADINLNLSKPYVFNIIDFYKLIKTFFEIRNKFDVIHFNTGTSLIDGIFENHYLLDLPFYSKKSKIFVTYNGDDARLVVDSYKRNHITYFNKPTYYNYYEDNLKKKRIKKVAKYANHIFSVNPDLLWFLPEEKSSFVPYSLDIQNIPKISINYKNKKLKIVHAPTHRPTKGTDIILNVINKLQARYKDSFEFIMIEQKSNQDALELYKQADLVIDQILAGWYGGFAVEVMKMGKPVAVYIREEDLKFIPVEMANDLKQSIINVNPYNLEEMLEKCIEDRIYLYEKAELAYEYVNKWHCPIKVAQTIIEKYETC